MATKTVAAYSTVTTPALTDEHLIAQSAVTYNETNQQIHDTAFLLTAKTTPIDADTMPLNDTAAANVGKKVTWANIKATLKAYFDPLYIALTGNQPIAGVKTFTDGIISAVTGNVTGNCSGSSGSCTGNAATATTCSGNAGTVTNGVYTAGDQTVNGVKTFGSIPVAPASDPTTANQLTRKTYVDNFLSGTKLETIDNTNWSQATAGDGTWYNPTNLSISLTDGIWLVFYGVGLSFSGSSHKLLATFSSANNSQLDAKYTSGPSDALFAYLSKSFYIDVTGTVTYYINVARVGGNTGTLAVFDNDYGNALMTAIKIGA